MAWGNNDEGQCNVPAARDFVAIAASRYYGVGLHSNGTVSVWGQGNRTISHATFVAVATGMWHVSALTDDGSIFCIWYSLDMGQCTMQGGKYTAIDVYALGSYSYGLRQEGSIVSGGYFTSPDKGKVPSGNDFVAVSGGTGFCVALRRDGSLAVAGNNSYGQCDIPHGNDFVAMDAGTKYALALKREGTLVAWGGHETDWGQLNVPSGNYYIAVCAGVVHNVAIASTAPPVEGNLFYVDAAPGNDGCTGRTLQQALRTIQKAVDKAKSGNTIIVLPGTYAGAGNRDIRFNGKNLVLRSTDPNCSTVVAATAIDCDGTPASYHRAFIFDSGEDANAIVAGFTITDGYADYGGMVLCLAASPTIS